MFSSWKILFLLLALLLAAPGARAQEETRESGWPFVPLTRPAVPEIKHKSWVKNPVDAFVLARLEQAGLEPNPPADRLVLLRRVTFDLTGLAPTPAERDAFLNDRSADAYERLVERLLASPRFGERWAEHWLDVVRYAETEGFKVDRWRPEAHRYRDYVIRAFNDDLPYDHFLSQQLAGDELEPENPDALIATGLYRLQPEETNGSNYRQIRQEIFDDITDVFGATFLGLTVGCARCHDHKFDPISQTDYYRLQAFFTPLLQHDDVPLASREARERYEKQLSVWKEKTQGVRAAIDQLLEPVGQKVFAESVVVFDPDTQEALKTPAKKRGPLQRQLAELASKQIKRKVSRMHRRLSAEEKARYDALQKALAQFDALKPAPLPLAMSATDVSPEAPATHRLKNGNYLKPREEVQPGFPECLDKHVPQIRPTAEHPESTGRRAALAHWLCRPDHPLTARVICNRLWQHHMGQGIVATPNDFGVVGEHATHPQLLDYLATDLVRKNWKLKAVHRLIVTSAAYCQASAAERNPAAVRAAAVDPADKLLWHARVKRREAEAIRDAVLQASGQLNLRMFGPSALPILPEPLVQNRYAWSPDDHPEDRFRRSIYVYSRRNLQYPLFDVFDQPDRVSSCPRRVNTTTPSQALVMLNGEFTLNQARYMSGQLLKTHARDKTRGLIRKAYLGAYGREPSLDAYAAAEDFLDHQTKLIAAGRPPARESLPEPMPEGVNPAFAAAVVDFCHGLMNTAEFLYVE